MRVVGMDIHRVFAEAVMLDDGRAVRLGRIGMTREHLAAFARKPRRDDHVVVTGASPAPRPPAESRLRKAAPARSRQ